MGLKLLYHGPTGYSCCSKLFTLLQSPNSQPCILLYTMLSFFTNCPKRCIYYHIFLIMPQKQYKVRAYLTEVTLPCKSDPGLTAISWQFSICVRMIQDIALWIKQIPKQAGFVPVRLYVLFQIMNMASFAFTCLVVNHGKALVFKIKIHKPATFWNDFAHNTLNTLYFCIIHEYWNNCGHNVGSHLE